MAGGFFTSDLRDTVSGLVVVDKTATEFSPADKLRGTTREGKRRGENSFWPMGDFMASWRAIPKQCLGWSLDGE